MLHAGSFPKTIQAIQSEQLTVQADKPRYRTLGEYDQYLFEDPHVMAGEIAVEASDALMATYLAPYMTPSFDKMLRGMHKLFGDVHWADMAGGHGIALRQMAGRVGIDSWLSLTNVDVLDPDLNALRPHGENSVMAKAPEVLYGGSIEPLHIQADIQVAALPQPAQVITSIETIQYVDDPLLAVANMYNNLAPDGIMIVATDMVWSERITYAAVPDAPVPNLAAPIADLLSTLSQQGVEYRTRSLLFRNHAQWMAQADPADREASRTYLMNLVVRKQPDTQLQVNTTVEAVRQLPFGYKTVAYTAPADSRQPVIEVITG